MERVKSHFFAIIAVTVSIIVVAIVAIALTITISVGHKQGDRIVDCAPGFHNVSGPASDCVQNIPSHAPAP
ncbi:MAG: hypothetical protein ACYCZY_08245 [Lacisediminihabitans sp.]